MLRFNEVLAGPPPDDADGVLTLTFDQRRKSRLRAALDDGREVGAAAAARNDPARRRPPARRGRRGRRGARRRRDPVGRVDGRRAPAAARGVPPGQPPRAAADRRRLRRLRARSRARRHGARAGVDGRVARRAVRAGGGAFATITITSTSTSRQRSRGRSRSRARQRSRGRPRSRSRHGHEHEHAHNAADPFALLRLLQLVSPTLPIGTFAYSQGLEAAVAAGWITDEPTARDWIGGLLDHTLASLDLPVLARLHAAWSRRRRQRRSSTWSRFLAASRARAELRTEERQLGATLARVLDGLGLAGARGWIASADVTYAAMFALAAVRWEIPLAHRAARLRLRLARGADQRRRAPGAARPERRPAHPARARRAHPRRRRARARARRRRARRRRARARRRERAPRDPVLAPVSIVSRTLATTQPGASP